MSIDVRPWRGNLTHWAGVTPDTTGTLRIARVGTPEPATDVEDGTFVGQWPTGWMDVGRTVSPWFSYHVETVDGIEFHICTMRILYEVEARELAIGWESLDHTTRVVASRAVTLSAPDGQVFRLTDNPPFHLYGAGKSLRHKP